MPLWVLINIQYIETQNPLKFGLTVREIQRLRGKRVYKRVRLRDRVYKLLIRERKKSVLWTVLKSNVIKLLLKGKKLKNN